MPVDPVLTFEDVTFGYGPSVAVEGISFAVERGDFVALIGPNGSGKTTLVKLALGLERPQRGRVLLFGQEVQRFCQWHRVSYVPQSVNAFTVRFPATVGEVISYAEYRGIDPLAILRRGLSPAVRQALQAVGMWEQRGQLIGELSGGQQQRVLIARALVHRTELLLLDEPTAGVDVAGEERLYSLLRDMRQQHGVTIILVSHDVGVVLHEATKVVCINRKLRFYGAAREVTDADLAHLYGFPVDLVFHRHD
ncbi:MAG: metal ABC transporter ATP-binding protein [Chloroflexi bacterium]|nr:metal ABC transporter ATP-binding protein [Chloroflexota bacterium]